MQILILSNIIQVTSFAARLPLCIATLLVIANLCVAQSPRLPDTAIDSTTMAVVRIDTKQLSGQTLTAEWTKISPEFGKMLTEFCQLAEEQPLYLTFSIPYGEGAPIVQLFAPKSLGNGKFSQHPFLANSSPRSVDSDWVAFASQDAHVAKHSSTPAITETQAKLRSHQFEQGAVQFAILPPAYVRSVVQELLPALPASLGGGPSSVLTEGLLSATGEIDLQRNALSIEIQSANHEAANRLAALLPPLLEAWFKWRSKSQSSSVAALLAANPPAVVDDKITWQFTVDAADLAKLVGPIDSQQKMNRFKQIMLAIHNFESANKYLPPLKSSLNADGSSKLSWRVHLLPYLGESELYQQFHLEEAWDSPHNRPMVERIPKIYRVNNLPGFDGGMPAGYTTVLAPAGEDTVLGSLKVVTFSRITDGTSNTICLVDGKPENAVPWTSPQDYVFDPQQPLSGVHIDTEGRVVVAMGDGSVRRIKDDLPAETYVNLFHMSDGNIVQFNE